MLDLQKSDDKLRAMMGFVDWDCNNFAAILRPYDRHIKNRYDLMIKKQAILQKVDMGNNTYVRVYHHLVWGTKNRELLIAPEFRDDLYKYIYGIMTKMGWHVIAIGGTQDHIHISFCVQKMHNVSEIVRCIKANSSQFVRYNNNSNFAWQNGLPVVAT